MKARIKKDVRPYGGRTFDVLVLGSRNGQEYLKLDVVSRTGKKRPRRYPRHEVDLLPDDPIEHPLIVDLPDTWTQK